MGRATEKWNNYLDFYIHMKRYGTMLNMEPKPEVLCRAPHMGPNVWIVDYLGTRISVMDMGNGTYRAGDMVTVWDQITARLNFLRNRMPAAQTGGNTFAKTAIASRQTR